MEDIEDEMGKSSHHFVAGALAGTAEHCGMYPIDTIKTHIQAKSTIDKGLIETGRTIFRSGGISAFFRGITAVVYGAAPSHALYFASYEFVKNKMGGNTPGNHPFIFALSGIIATTLGDAVMTPLDVVKQKRQLNLKTYIGTFNCMRTVIAVEGFRALYAGYTTTLFMNIPFHAIYFNVYEFLRKLMYKSDKFSPGVHFLSGAGAGSFAAGITNPLDVAKTRLQTQGDIGGRHYHGMFRTVYSIWIDEGIRGLSRGIFPRILFHSFSASILWTTYEYFKYILGAHE